MNLKQLEVFIAVIESGSFSKGAEATYLTQSTVSQHIAALEQELDLRLLDRTGRGALPTPAGKILLEQARKVLAASDAVYEAMNRFKTGEETHFVMGGSNIPATHLIPTILPHLRKRFPHLQITLAMGDSKEIVDRLCREEIEIGVVGCGSAPEGITLIPLLEEEICLVAGPGQAWHGRNEISVDELYDGELIFREPGSGTVRTVIDRLAGAGVDPGKLTIIAHLGSNEAVKNAVLAGAGIAFLPGTSIRNELETGALSRIKLHDIIISRRFHLISRTGRELSPAAGAFAEIMISTWGAGQATDHFQP